MKKAFITVTWANQRTVIQKPPTFNELMWVAYDRLKITQPVIACAYLTSYDLGQYIEVKLDNALYLTVTNGSNVTFRPDGRPSLQEVIDKETKEEEEALKAAGTTSGEQVGPAIQIFQRMLVLC